MTDAQIEAMMYDAEVMQTSPESDRAKWQIRMVGHVLALAAEVRRRISPDDHEHVIASCLAYERENDSLRARLAEVTDQAKRAGDRVDAIEAELAEAASVLAAAEKSKP